MYGVKSKRSTVSAFVRTAARGVLQIEGMWEERGLHVPGREGSCCVIAGVRPGLRTYEGATAES